MKAYYQKVVILDKKEYELLKRVFASFQPSELEDDMVTGREKEMLRKQMLNLAIKVCGGSQLT